jgi:hypothetical protein
MAIKATFRESRRPIAMQVPSPKSNAAQVGGSTCTPHVSNDHFDFL